MVDSSFFVPGNLSPEQIAELLAMMETNASRDWPISVTEGGTLTIPESDVTAGAFLDGAGPINNFTVNLNDGKGGQLFFIKTKQPIDALTLGNSGLAAPVNLPAPGGAFVLANRSPGKWEIVATF